MLGMQHLMLGMQGLIVTALPGRQWDSDTGAGGPVGVESGRVLYRS